MKKISALITSLLLMALCVSPAFAANAKKMAILDANERIYHIIKEIIK